MFAAQRRAQLVVAAGLTTLPACARPAEPFYCPSVGEGELVVSELRGPQSDADTWGQWIELFNASGEDIDVFGLRVTMVPLSGAAQDVILVRTDPIEVPVDGYVVLGRFDDARRPDHVDYGFTIDLEDDLLPAARVEIEACGVLTDTTIYRSLPTLGSLALDGAMPPDAEANDDETRWCDDVNEPPPEGPQTEIGVPGTPGEENPPCPP